jgi:hypothetical protein
VLRGSAGRCATFQEPSSGRKIIVARRAHGAMSSLSPTLDSIAVVSAVDPLLSRLASSLNRDVTVSGAAALNSRYGDGSISLHAALEGVMNFSSEKVAFWHGNSKTIPK